jgi:hypothetical protein
MSSSSEMSNPMHGNIENPYDLYPMKTRPGAMFRPDPMTPPNYYNEPFLVNGEQSINGPYPGTDMYVLPYAPGSEVNGDALPIPTNSLIEKFYAGVKDDDDDDDEEGFIDTEHVIASTHNSEHNESFIMQSN